MGITEDIFSQAVRQDSEDSYEEDSFCVGSQVEWDTGMDTLDVLENRAERGRGETPGKRKRGDSGDNGKGKKRKRIIAPASDDETFIQIPDDSPDKLGNDEMAGVNFDDFNSSFPESQSLLPGVEDDRILLQPDLSTSILEGEKFSIIISSMEVNKVPEVISSLKHIHRLAVSIRPNEVASFILGQNCAAHRVSEMEFGTGTMKDKLAEGEGQQGAVQQYYPHSRVGEGEAWGQTKEWDKDQAAGPDRWPASYGGRGGNVQHGPAGDRHNPGRVGPARE